MFNPLLTSLIICKIALSRILYTGTGTLFVHQNGLFGYGSVYLTMDGNQVLYTETTKATNPSTDLYLLMLFDR